MKILYITYIDFTAAASGSSMRPQKMYEAFLQEGHEVKLLCGSQETKNRKNRVAAVREINRWLDANRPDICYIESPVYPILLRCDRMLIRRIHRMGIPIGYFYRDFYRRFPQLYPRRTDFSGRVKELWLDILQKRTDRLLEKADIVYLPSKECEKLFSYRDMRPLPPAGENRITERHPEEKTLFYVGGLDEGYGVSVLLESVNRLAQADGSYRLILVCREREWEKYISPYKCASWLEVHHTSGDGLEPLYARAAAAVLPIKPTEYTDFAVNVKLFEYMGHALPILASEAKAIAEIVRKNGVGIVVPFEADAMAEGIRKLTASVEERQKIEAQCTRVLTESHLWKHRARQVISELGQKRPDAP